MAKMTVTRDVAVAILKSVKFVVADKWDDDKLQAKMRDLGKIDGADALIDAIEDENLRKVGKKAMFACQKEVPIFVVSPGGGGDEGDEDVKEDTKKVKAAKPTKPVKPAAKPEKPVAKEKAEKPAKPKKEKSPVEVDEWGARKGTRTARINAVLLAGDPLTTQEIEKKANARAIHSHLSKLKSLNFITRTADGKYQSASAAGKPKAVKKKK